MSKIEGILGKIGIAKQEARVYLALLGLQEARTGMLCSYTKIASSNIYKILESLIKKGLVSFRVQNNIKVFMPSPPESLNEIFLEKQRKLEEEQKELAKAISDLKKIELEEKPQTNYKYYEGISGIKSLWHEINSKMRKENLIRIYTGKKGVYNRLLASFDEHHNLRKKKNIKEKLIFPKGELKIAEKRRNKITQIKFMDMENEAEWGVCNDTFHIHYYPVKKKPYGFLIKDAVFAKTFAQVFDQLWEKAKQ